MMGLSNSGSFEIENVEDLAQKPAKGQRLQAPWKKILPQQKESYAKAKTANPGKSWPPNKGSAKKWKFHGFGRGRR